MPKALALTRHSVELLLRMAPGPGSQGAFVSSLIEAEYARREERQRVLAELARLAEAGSVGREAS